MSDFSTGQPSGLRVRQIQVDAKGKPVLDANGQEIETVVVHVPIAVEAAGGAVIAGFVADIQAKGPDLALVRADAAIAGQDPTVAETAFTAAQAAATVETAPALSTPTGGAR